MKANLKNILLISFILTSGLLMSQPSLPSTKGSRASNAVATDTNQWTISLKPNGDFSGSVKDDQSSSKAAFSSLGIQANNKNHTVTIDFTLLANNKEVEDKKGDNLSFGTNLLLPSNSISGFGSFTATYFVKSFRSFRSTGFSGLSFWDQDKLGLFSYFQLNKSSWNVDSSQLSVLSNVYGVGLNYCFFEEDIGEKSVSLNFRLGISGRGLGGDIARDEYKTERQKILKSDRTNYIGFEFVPTLQVGNLYAQIIMSHFSKSDKINGFSGWQAIFNLGIREFINLN